LFELPQLFFFVGAALALLLVPGPAVLYIVARSVHQGRLAGLASVLGIETASLLHTIAASFGLSAILLTSAMAFDVVKYLGAAYLIYLGIRTFISSDEGHNNEISPPTTLWQIYSQGVVVNLLNPKLRFSSSHFCRNSLTLRGAIPLCR
jgi:threonine/homoserine/homoserine lactone efflux protein